MSAEVWESSQREASVFVSVLCLLCTCTAAVWPIFTALCYSRLPKRHGTKIEVTGALARWVRRKAKSSNQDFCIPESCGGRKWKREKSRGADGALGTAGGVDGSRLNGTNATHALGITFPASAWTFQKMFQKMQKMIQSGNCASKHRKQLQLLLIWMSKTRELRNIHLFFRCILKTSKVRAK